MTNKPGEPAVEWCMLMKDDVKYGSTGIEINAGESVLHLFPDFDEHGMFIDIKDAKEVRWRVYKDKRVRLPTSPKEPR